MIRIRRSRKYPLLWVVSGYVGKLKILQTELHYQAYEAALRHAKQLMVARLTELKKKIEEVEAELNQ